MRRFVSAFFLLAALPSAACATGGLFCEAGDGNVKFRANAGLQHGGANGLLNFAADLEIKVKAAPPDFRALHLDGAAVAQHWLDNREFKLRLYTERSEGPFGAVEFLIETKAIDEGNYKGVYTLRVENMESEKDSEPRIVKLSGRISCSVE